MGSIDDNALDHVHFQGGVPLEFTMSSHWDAARLRRLLAMATTR